MTLLPTSKMEPWDDDVFADIEEAGRVQLNPQQRRALHVQVETYMAGLEFCKKVGDVCMRYHREWLDRFIKSLDETIQILRKPSGVKFDVFLGAGLLPPDAGRRFLENEIGRLKSLRDSSVEERKKLGQQGRKPPFHLHKLLGGLEFTFRDAGGL